MVRTCCYWKYQNFASRPHRTTPWPHWFAIWAHVIIHIYQILTSFSFCQSLSGFHLEFREACGLLRTSATLTIFSIPISHVKRWAQADVTPRCVATDLRISRPDLPSSDDAERDGWYVWGISAGVNVDGGRFSLHHLAINYSVVNLKDSFQTLLAFAGSHLPPVDQETGSNQSRVR